MYISLQQTLQCVQSDSDGVGVLGAQIRLALNAYREPEALYECRVLKDRVRGDALLPGDQRKRRYLDPERLPQTPMIKGIAVDRFTLFVELAPLDRERLRGASLPNEVRLNVDRHEMWHGRRKLAHIAYAPPDVQRDHGERWLWMIGWSKLPQESLDLAIKTLDLFHEAELFQGKRPAPPRPQSNAGPAPLEKRLGMQLELIQEQVPVLAMRHEARLEQAPRLEQQLGLQQLQRFERWLSRNPVQAIQESLEKDDSAEGQARLVKFIEFKMARDVREAARAAGQDIDWSQARRIVRKAMQR